MTDRSNKRKLFLGAAWSISTRWSIRGIGLINTIIMARLLVPEDYGIVAMAMLIVSLIQAIVDFGASTAILRKNEVGIEEINSAWTLVIIQNVVIALILVALAPLAIIYFKEPRIFNILCLLAACIALTGASNIGLTLAQKSFNFSVTFRVNVTSKIIGVLATVLSGYYLRDYRSLIIGLVVGFLSTFILSYVMHPYRPRWCTTKIPEIWNITKWMMFGGIGGFVAKRGDELIAARISTPAEFGQYNVGADLGQMPVGEIGHSLIRALLPVLSTMPDDVKRVNSAVLKTLASYNTITLPIGFGFAALATPVATILLGPSWVEAIHFVSAFAIASALRNIQYPLMSLLYLRGLTREMSQGVWLELLVFLVMAAILIPVSFLNGLVISRIIGIVANMAYTFYLVNINCGILLKEILFNAGRPFVGAVLMSLGSFHIIKFVENDIVKIVAGTIFGIVLFTIWSAITWLVAKRPDGLESLCFDFIKEKWKGYI